MISVRGKNVFVVQSLYGDHRQSGNDKLCRLLFFIGALKDAAAARVTAVVPYLAYARKDRKTKPRDPVTTRYVAALFEAVGTDTVMTLDVHNLAAFQMPSAAAEMVNFIAVGELEPAPANRIAKDLSTVKVAASRPAALVP